MAVHSGELRLSTEGDTDVIDITAGVQRIVDGSGLSAGHALAFVRGSTAAITTMEYEPGGVSDLREMLERLIPTAGDYEHNRLNHDTNSHAHQRASIVGPSAAVPFLEGRLGARHLAAAGVDRLRRPRSRADGRRPGAGLTGQGPTATSERSESTFQIPP